MGSRLTASPAAISGGGAASRRSPAPRRPGRRCSRPELRPRRGAWESESSEAEEARVGGGGVGGSEGTGPRTWGSVLPPSLPKKKKRRRRYNTATKHLASSFNGLLCKMTDSFAKTQGVLQKESPVRMVGGGGLGVPAKKEHDHNKKPKIRKSP